MDDMNAQEIIDIIPTGHENAITRKRLHAITGLPDRTIREAISRGNEVVINLQDGKGYFKPDPVKDRDFLRRYMLQEHSRMECIKKRVELAKKYQKAGVSAHDPQDSGFQNSLFHQMSLEELL